MPLATSTSTLPQVFMTSLARCGEDSSDVSPCLDHLYKPHGRYSRFFGQKLRCLGKGVILRAGRATTSYLRNATLGAHAIAVVMKIWNIWDGFHKELYLYGHPRYLRPLQGLCVPSIIGVFSTSEGLANMAMEPPHPHAWRVADRSLSVGEKYAIVDAYAQIHARGVLHGDVALRHMLIGRDGKATIINFRQASCLEPAMQIGLSSCSTDEFQLEIRQVKFLLDYQGAREFEYRLAREWRSVTKMKTREAVSSFSPFPIPETTLRQWDASTLEDLPPPSLPFYVPNALDISIQPVSWIPGDMPLSQDDLSYPNSEEDQLQSGAIPEIFTTHVRFSQVDDHDDDNRPSPSTSPSHPRSKGKQPEYDSHSDVMSNGPPYGHHRFEPESSPTRIDQSLHGTRHHIFDSGQQEHRVAGTSRTPWKYTEATTVAANDEPDILVAPRSAVISSDDSFMSRSLDRSLLNDDDHSDQPLSHYIERSPPLLWTPLPLTVSHSPPPSHDLHNSTHLQCPDEGPAAHYEFPPQFDYTSDSSSDTSVSTTNAPYEWTDSEPSSPVGALVAPQDDLHAFPTVDNSNVSLLFDLSPDANIEFVGEFLLENMQPSFKAREAVPVHHKRKRLFLMEEDVDGERARKQRCVER